MMRPKQFVFTSNGTSQSIPLDYYVNGYALGVTISTTGGTAGTATYTVQHTFDNPFESTFATTSVWLNHDASNMVAATTNQDSNYSVPPRATRIILSNVSAASVRYTIVPMGAM